MARVEPFTHGVHGKQLGALKGSMRIRRDLVRSDTTEDWEMRTVQVSHEMASEAYALPQPFHKDPADRLLVAASRCHDLTLLTADERILTYRGVRSRDARR